MKIWSRFAAVLSLIPLTAGVSSLGINYVGTWTQLRPPTRPSGRSHTAVTYDALSGRVLLFGGGGAFAGSPGDDTWVWNGTNWLRLRPTRHPQARQGASLAFDSSTNTAVLFGGFGLSPSIAVETWLWSGHSWILARPENNPAPRWDASMAYDASTKQIVLFGGNVLARGGFMPAAASTTWIWNGSNWRSQDQIGGPVGRSGAVMAFDPSSHQEILFGGERTSSGLLGDTWNWNGHAWMRLQPKSSPAARFGASLAYDARLRGLVLFGGTSFRPYRLLSDSWLWQGNSWVRLDLKSSPSARNWSALVNDQTSGQLLLFGGDGVSGLLNQSWTLTLR